MTSLCFTFVKTQIIRQKSMWSYIISLLTQTFLLSTTKIHLCVYDEIQPNFVINFTGNAMIVLGVTKWESPLTSFNRDSLAKGYAYLYYRQSCSRITSITKHFPRHTHAFISLIQNKTATTCPSKNGSPSLWKANKYLWCFKVTVWYLVNFENSQTYCEILRTSHSQSRDNNN